MTDLADIPTALTAGYIELQDDRGATYAGGNQFITIFEKLLSGEPGARGFSLRVQGGSVLSQADADAKALANLNLVRAARYGSGAVPNGGMLPANAGWTHTPDVT